MQLHYLEKGRGDPLILLHGNGENSGYFSRQIDCFQTRYRVIAPDTRGHGASPRGTAPFTLGQFAEDLREFMDQQGIGRAHLLGFSDGGNIALLFALRYPERVLSLILNGANLFPAGVKRRYQLPIELGFRIASLFAKRSPEAKKHAELLALMVKEPDLSPGDLAALLLPVLVMAGTKDMIREDHTRLIGESIPGARLVFIDGGHFIAAENPDAFNRAVEAFLAGVSPKPPRDPGG